MTQRPVRMGLAGTERAMISRAARKEYTGMPNRNPDSGIVFKIKQYLRKEHRIPFAQIKTECTVRFTRSGCELLGTLNFEEISRIRGLVHTPDIVATGKDGKPLFIIEQDGRIHEFERLVKKDKMRNRHYAKAGIPYAVLSTQEIRSKEDDHGRMP